MDPGNPGNPTNPNPVAGNISGNVQYLGIVGVEASTSDNEVEAFGAFFEYPRSLGGELFNEAFNPTLDTCTVEVVEVLEGSNTQLPEIDSTDVPTFVSAGKVLNLTSQAGSYLDLQRQTLAGFQFYGTEQGAISGTVPAQLTLDIPGEGVTVGCLVRYNGVFAFPAETRTELGEEFFAFSADISREATAIYQSGNAVLVLIASSAQ